MDIHNTQVPKGPFKFLSHSSRPYRVWAVLATMFVVFASVTATFVPYIFKKIVDSVNGVGGRGIEDVWFWAFMYVGAAFFSAMCWRGSGFTGMRWATGVRATGRESLTKHVTNHSYSFFSNRFAGAIGAKLKTATEGLKSMVEVFLWEWLSFSIKLLISIGLILYTNIYIGLVFVLWLLIITPINMILVKKKIPLGFAAQASDTKLTAHTVDVLTNITAMHDYARRPFELERIQEIINERRKAGLRNWTYSEWMLTLNSVLEAIFIGGMIFTTVYVWSIGLITPGDILLVLTLIMSIRNDLASLGNKFNSFAETISQVKEGLADILHEHDLKDEETAKELEVSGGEILMENLSFQYEKREIFHNLTFQIKPGERVGLVGRSGAGKSTLMKLLTRQYDVTRGKILIDNQNIQQVKQESLRNAIAIVPQEPLLFHRSLKENIKYGNLTSTSEDIIRAAEQAQAHSFIDRLPKKYDTLVGERGVKLSGGERQRVAIARAFLKNAKILLLDEATSSLDSESENLIREALEKLMEGKTVIAIAHRLSTLRAMDRIIVLDKGEIVEDGNHEELLKNGGIYAELWSHQAGGFIKEE